MKNKLFISLLGLCLFLMTACGKKNTTSDITSNVLLSPQVEETSESKNSNESKNNTKNKVKEQEGFKHLNEIILTDTENTISVIKSDYEKLVTDIDTYEKYLNNTDLTVESSQ